MIVEDFKEFYCSDRKVVPANWNASIIKYVEFASHLNIVAMVLNRWSKFESFLRRMIDGMHKQPHEDEIRHHFEANSYYQWCAADSSPGVLQNWITGGVLV
jgi:hypothetical protein